MESITFALSVTEGYLFLAMMASCAVLCGYVIFGRCRRGSSESRPNGSSPTQTSYLPLLSAPVAVFAALWCAGRLAGPLVWWLWYGDTRAPVEWIVELINGIVASGAAAIVFVKLYTGTTTQRYRRIVISAAAVVGALVTSAYVANYADRIDGWDARSIAEGHFEGMSFEGSLFIAPGAKRRIVEDPPRDVEYSDRPYRTFVLCFGDARLAAMSVAPYGRWFWSRGGSGPLTPPTATFSRGEDIVANGRDSSSFHRKDKVVAALRRIGSDYPNSPAAERASDLLEELAGDEE